MKAERNFFLFTFECVFALARMAKYLPVPTKVHYQHEGSWNGHINLILISSRTASPFRLRYNRFLTNGSDVYKFVSHPLIDSSLRKPEAPPRCDKLLPVLSKHNPKRTMIVSRMKNHFYGIEHKKLCTKLQCFNNEGRISHLKDLPTA